MGRGGGETKAGAFERAHATRYPARIEARRARHAAEDAPMQVAVESLDADAALKGYIKDRFGDVIDLASAQGIDHSLAMLDDALDSASLDFSLPAPERARARDLLARVRGVNKELAELELYAREPEQYDPDGTLFERGAELVRAELEKLRERLPTKNELYLMTWAQPFQELRELATERERGELGRLDYCIDSIRAVQRGVKRTLRVAGSAIRSLARTKTGAAALISGSASTAAVVATSEVQTVLAASALFAIGSAVHAGYRKLRPRRPEDQAQIS